tara:strand:+ start:1558 stop:1821 length:264 start_codon:yes stop_codon:yes gene_type:complete
MGINLTKPTVKDVLWHLKLEILNLSEPGDNIIHLRTDFKNDLGFDSLDLIDLSSRMEDLFSIKLPEDLSHIQSVKDLFIECINPLKY